MSVYKEFKKEKPEFSGLYLFTMKNATFGIISYYDADENKWKSFDKSYMLPNPELWASIEQPKR